MSSESRFLGSYTDKNLIIQSKQDHNMMPKLGLVKYELRLKTALAAAEPRRTTRDAQTKLVKETMND